MTTPLLPEQAVIALGVLQERVRVLGDGAYSVRIAQEIGSGYYQTTSVWWSQPVSAAMAAVLLRQYYPEELPLASIEVVVSATASVVLDVPEHESLAERAERARPRRQRTTRTAGTLGGSTTVTTSINAAGTTWTIIDDLQDLQF